MDWWVWLIIAIVVVIAIVALVLVIQAKRRSGGVIIVDPKQGKGSKR